MKRWIALAACMMTVAACQDGAEPMGPSADAVLPANLLGLSPLVNIDPVLTSLLNSSASTDQLQVLVNFNESLTSSTVLSGLLTGLGAGTMGFEHLPMVFAVATPAQIAAMTNLPGVTGIYSNKELEYFLAESVPSINGHLAHAAGYTGKGVGIAILDSGVDGAYNPDLKHPTRTVQNVKILADAGDILPALGESVPTPAGALYAENVGSSETSSGHGTHVAGIAAGDGTASGAKYVGVAPGANLIGLGAGEAISVLWALAGFDWVLDNHAEYNIQVLNNSWGTTGDFDPAHPINIASKKIYDRGITVVFAAGNEGPGENTLNPYSVAPWVISVAASCKTVSPDPTNGAGQCAGGFLADFSSRGRRGDPMYHPDITAPGVNIVSTRSIFGVVIGGTAVPADLLDCAISQPHLAYYMCIGGTSMSAPHVSGTIALMEEAAKGRLTPDGALNALRRTARPVAGYGEWEVGAGYMDAWAAVRYVRR